jgi:hypothetical protein
VRQEVHLAMQRCPSAITPQSGGRALLASIAFRRLGA